MTRGTGPYPFPTLPGPARHFVSIAAVVILFYAARSPATVLDEGGFFLLLGILVLGSAWFAGTGAALAVTVLGAIFGAVTASGTLTAAVHTHLALFVLQGLLLTALVAELRRARRSAEREARVAHAARLEGEAANRMKDEFLATISHELRTPLNAVLGWVHLIRTGKLDGVTAQRGFESIERNVRLQAQLTSDLLDISKALTGKLRIDSRPVSLRGIVQEAVTSVSTAAEAKDVRVNLTAPEVTVVVRGDADRLRQVVWHLLANAIKFTPRGGAVQVSIDANDAASVTVRDTGPGIDPEFLPRIFDRFTQADASTTRSAGGLGVGLSLVREIVERHAGEINVRNDAGGRGAVFTMRLPLHPEDQRVRPPLRLPATIAVGSPPLTGVRVLVLDRDRDGRDLVSVILEQRGAVVRLVDSVDEALEALEAWRPDVLVSDALSPDRDSYSLVGKVQSLESDRGGRIPALALTTFSRTNQEMRRLLSDVHRDLPKPVEPAILAAEIARLAGRERRRAQR
ncbi:MAG: hybrid sensor histidine kinase/response regulator [Acidobacteria bacterium]|nr:MAG: hybrid sensor histidine kinase/response regulator [Acidobacteriota bacterium]